MSLERRNYVLICLLIDEDCLLIDKADDEITVRLRVGIKQKECRLN